MRWIPWICTALVVAFVVWLYLDNQSLRVDITNLDNVVQQQKAILKDVQEQAERLESLNTKTTNAEKKLSQRSLTTDPKIGSNDTEIDEIGHSIEKLSGRQ